MKRIKSILRCIPHWARAMFNLFLIVILVLIGYCFCGCPALSPKQQFRREEKANLTGPAAILDTVSLEGSSYLYPYDKMVIGESAQGVSLFCYNTGNWKQNTFTYSEKTGEVTLLVVPGGITQPKHLGTVPILVFDKMSDAMYADLELELNVQQDSVNFQGKYKLTGERKSDGFFLFSLPGGAGEEGDAMWLLTRICDDDDYYGRYVGVGASATVRFYDQEKNLLLQKLIQI